MLIYKYSALEKCGIEKSGILIAKNYSDAYDKLLNRNFHPISIKKLLFISKKVDIEDLLLFFMHVNFQIKCGVNIEEAIASFVEFNNNKVLNASLIDILESLQSGCSLSESFEKCSNIFGNIITGLLKSADTSGNLSETISNILYFLKLEKTWKTNVKTAVYYPIFLVTVAVSVLLLSISVLAPQIMSLSYEIGYDKLPFLTKVVMQCVPDNSENAAFYVLLFFAVFLFMIFYKKTKYVIYYLLHYIPAINSLIIKVSLWQTFKILQISLNAKVDFISAINLAIDSIDFQYIKDSISKARDDVMNGYKIADSFAKIPFMTSAIIVAVYVGDEGNDLTNSFSHISDGLYEEITSEIKSLGKNLSIGLTLFTGLIFIIILYSLFYPIYNYVEIVGT